MSDQTFFIARDVLHGVFNGDARVVRQFETMQERVASASEASTSNLSDTQALKDATFVTLSANAELPNERVLALGSGLSFDLSTEGEVRIDADVFTSGGWRVQFSLAGETTLALPTAGIVATRDQPETFSNKTLSAPKLSSLGDYADDAAAATGGVPVGGVYRNGSALQVRVA